MQLLVEQHAQPAVQQVLEAACSTDAELAGDAPSTGMVVVSMAPSAQHDKEAQRKYMSTFAHHLRASHQQAQ